MFDTVLVANRGEIALRVMRACRELGLRTVAVYSEADRNAPHVLYADAAYLIGPGPSIESYLLGDKVIAVAKEAGAGAIHPGYGFLAENADFAQTVLDAGLVFIGPPPEAMRRMGGKVAARREAMAAGVPIVPGVQEPVQDVATVRELAGQFGFPLAIKAVSGGGGRGLRVVRSFDELENAYDSARREALSAFKDDSVYVERYLDRPRHIEIQVLADAHGNAVHLGERECSIQRRHQKLIEEAPSSAISPELRAEMGAAALRLVASVGYVSAGTLEFLYQDGEYFFLEMNTRIQVEHTVTEMVYGLDLVQAQIKIAQGERLSVTQAELTPRGYAIECRINAEDAGANFRPVLGTLGKYSEPTGFGVRVDSGVRAGWTIPQYYDSMLAKLVTWGRTRNEAIGRMQRALAEYQIEGITTLIPFHQAALAQAAFEAGDTTVNFIPQHPHIQVSGPASSEVSIAVDEQRSDPRRFDVEVNGKFFAVRVAEVGQPASNGNGRAQPNGASARAKASSSKPKQASNEIRSPIQGTIVAIRAEAGQQVEAGAVVFVVEAMKMENEVSAPHAGTLAEIKVTVGATIESGALLALFAEA
jgi:acetyl-CoA/propionyl-CoA carboxylase biotin carboxyl carrier protein